jgi:dTDP-4-dehydrorhamnose reductase
MAHDPRPILVIGCSGQVGWELVRTLAPLGRVVGASIEGQHGPRVDLTQPQSLEALLQETQPRLVVNAAAYTAVDRAEQEPQRAELINAEAVGQLGRLAGARALPVIHYSTDFVFRGDAALPYREQDPTGPLSVYGKTKLAGEQALAASGAPHLILRTSWVYGVRGANFLLTMRRLFAERPELRVVDDQTGAPTWSRMIAEATAQIAAAIMGGAADLAEVQGVYHLSAGGSTSWYGFARSIWTHLGADCRLLPIPTSEYPTPARRPAYSVLNNDRLHQVFGIRLPEWERSLRHCLDDLS